MKRFLPLLFLLAAARIIPMEWPSPAGVITRNFGWNDKGQPHLGISFLGEKEIFTAGKAELLYMRNEDDSASRLPSPLGSWLALDHNDGIISIYSRKDALFSLPVPGEIEKGRILGKAGISGWSNEKGFYFQLYDRKERRWINPSMVIPPPEDKRPPLILSVKLRDEHGKLFDPSQIKTLSQGRYYVLVEAVDTMLLPNEAPLAPYRIICSLNGGEVGALNFETFSVRDSSLMVYRNGLAPVKQVYAPYPLYEAAEVWFSRGQTSLEIIAQDIAGNERKVVFRLMVE